MRLFRRWEQAPRGSKVAMVSIMVLGLILRVFEVWRFNLSHPADVSALVGDEPAFNDLALALVEGTGFFAWPGRVPLYSMLLAVLHLVTGQSYDAIRYLQALAGISVVPLTYLLGRRVFPQSRAPAFIASFLAATSYALIEHAPRIQSEMLYLPVVLIAFNAVWDAVDQPRARHLAWAGVAVAISALVRPALLFFPAAFGVALMLRYPWRIALKGVTTFAMAMVATLSPWMAFTIARDGTLIPLQTSNAILWQGSPEYYHLLKDQGYSYQRVWTEVIYGPGWRAHDPTSIEGEKWWTARAIRSIKSEPGTYLRYAAEKLATYWVGDPNADWANSQVFNFAEMSKYFSRRQLFMIATSRGLPIIGLLAVLVLWRQWRRLVPLYAILIYVTVLHALTHAEFRLSSPFQPILMVLIGGASVAAWQSRSRVAIGSPHLAPLDQLDDGRRPTTPERATPGA